LPSIHRIFPPLADAINSLLNTAMSYKQLKDFDVAENGYRIPINEYSRCRYVSEAYVKLARIYWLRMNPIWQEGLIFLYNRNIFLAIRLGSHYYPTQINDNRRLPTEKTPYQIVM
jgi:hypothetical protein